MSEPYLGEIKLFCFQWAPKNWALCNGATLPISQNPALYALIGAQFGSSSAAEFSLPDLRGRVPVGTCDYYPRGASGGTEIVTLSLPECAAHTHNLVVAAKNADQFANSGGFFLATTTPFAGDLVQPSYLNVNADTALSSRSGSSTGGNQSHSNLQPTVTSNYCIALSGTYPPNDN